VFKVGGSHGPTSGWTKSKMASGHSNGHISISNGHISGPRVGFSGMADQMALFPVSPNPRWQLAAILENFE